MKYYYIYSILFVLTLFNCKHQAEKLNQNDKEIIEREIRKMFNSYHSDIKKDGLKAEFKYLDKSSDFFWVPPDYESALSFDSVKTILLSNSKFIHSIEFSWDTLQVFPLTKTIANYSGIVNGIMIDSTSSKSTFKIIESGTLIKRKDGWKLLNGQSRNLPVSNN